METNKDIFTKQEMQELTGCYTLAPGIKVRLVTKNQAGGTLVNEIMAVRRKNEDKPGFVFWQSYQQMVLRNPGVKGERKIGQGSNFFTLRTDIRLENPQERKIAPA